MADGNVFSVDFFSSLGELCATCSQKDKELHDLRKELGESQATFQVLRKKIIATDLLMRKYKDKTDDCEVRDKQIDVWFHKYGKSQNEVMLLESQLKQALGEMEPVKRAKIELETEIQRLEKEKEKLQNQLNDAEFLNNQYEMRVANLESFKNMKDEASTDTKKRNTALENSVLKPVLNPAVALKKSAGSPMKATQVKSQAGRISKLQTENKALNVEVKKQTRKEKRLENRLKRTEAKLSKYLDILVQKGLMTQKSKSKVMATVSRLDRNINSDIESDVHTGNDDEESMSEFETEDDDEEDKVKDKTEASDKTTVTASAAAVDRPGLDAGTTAVPDKTRTLPALPAPQTSSPSKSRLRNVWKKKGEKKTRERALSQVDEMLGSLDLSLSPFPPSPDPSLSPVEEMEDETSSPGSVGAECPMSDGDDHVTATHTDGATKDNSETVPSCLPVVPSLESNVLTAKNVSPASPVKNVSPASPVKNLSPASPVKNLSPASPVKNVSPASSVKNLSPASPVKNLSPASPVKNLSPASPVKNLSPASPVKNLSPGSPVKNVSPASPVKNLSPASPVKNLSPASPVKNLSPASPVKNLSPASPVKNLSPGSPVKNVSSALPDKNVSPISPVRNSSPASPVKNVSPASPVQNVSSALPDKNVSHISSVKNSSPASPVKNVSPALPDNNVLPTSPVQNVSPSLPGESVSLASLPDKSNEDNSSALPDRLRDDLALSSDESDEESSYGTRDKKVDGQKGELVRAVEQQLPCESSASQKRQGSSSFPDSFRDDLELSSDERDKEEEKVRTMEHQFPRQPSASQNQQNVGSVDMKDGEVRNADGFLDVEDNEVEDADGSVTKDTTTKLVHASVTKDHTTTPKPPSSLQCEAPQPHAQDAEKLDKTKLHKTQPRPHSHDTQPHNLRPHNTHPHNIHPHNTQPNKTQSQKAEQLKAEVLKETTSSSSSGSESEYDTSDLSFSDSSLPAQSPFVGRGRGRGRDGRRGRGARRSRPVQKRGQLDTLQPRSKDTSDRLVRPVLPESTPSPGGSGQAAGTLDQDSMNDASGNCVLSTSAKQCTQSISPVATLDDDSSRDSVPIGQSPRKKVSVIMESDFSETDDEGSVKKVPSKFQRVRRKVQPHPRGNKTPAIVKSDSTSSESDKENPAPVIDQPTTSSALPVSTRSSTLSDLTTCDTQAAPQTNTTIIHKKNQPENISVPQNHKLSLSHTSSPTHSVSRTKDSEGSMFSVSDQLGSDPAKIPSAVQGTTEGKRLTPTERGKAVSISSEGFDLSDMVLASYCPPQGDMNGAKISGKCDHSLNQQTEGRGDTGSCVSPQTAQPSQKQSVTSKSSDGEPAMVPNMKDNCVTDTVPKTPDKQQQIVEPILEDIKISATGTSGAEEERTENISEETPQDISSERPENVSAKIPENNSSGKVETVSSENGDIATKRMDSFSSEKLGNASSNSDTSIDEPRQFRPVGLCYLHLDHQYAVRVTSPIEDYNSRPNMADASTAVVTSHVQDSCDITEDIHMTDASTSKTTSCEEKPNNKAVDVNMADSSVVKDAVLSDVKSAVRGQQDISLADVQTAEPVAGGVSVDNDSNEISNQLSQQVCGCVHEQTSKNRHVAPEQSLRHVCDSIHKPISKNQHTAPEQSVRYVCDSIHKPISKTQHTGPEQSVQQVCDTVSDTVSQNQSKFSAGPAQENKCDQQVNTDSHVSGSSCAWRESEAGGQDGVSDSSIETAQMSIGALSSVQASSTEDQPSAELDYAQDSSNQQTGSKKEDKDGSPSTDSSTRADLPKFEGSHIQPCAELSVGDIEADCEQKQCEHHMTLVRPAARMLRAASVSTCEAEPGSSASTQHADAELDSNSRLDNSVVVREDDPASSATGVVDVFGSPDKQASEATSRMFGSPPHSIQLLSPTPPAHPPSFLSDSGYSSPFKRIRSDSVRSMSRTADIAEQKESSSQDSSVSKPVDASEQKDSVSSVSMVKNESTLADVAEHEDSVTKAESTNPISVEDKAPAQHSVSGLVDPTDVASDITEDLECGSDTTQTYTLTQELESSRSSSRLSAEGSTSSVEPAKEMPKAMAETIDSVLGKALASQSKMVLLQAVSVIIDEHCPCHTPLHSPDLEVCQKCTLNRDLCGQDCSSQQPPCINRKKKKQKHRSRKGTLQTDVGVVDSVAKNSLPVISSSVRVSSSATTSSHSNPPASASSKTVARRSPVQKLLPSSASWKEGRRTSDLSSAVKQAKREMMLRQQSLIETDSSSNASEPVELQSVSFVPKAGQKRKIAEKTTCSQQTAGVKRHQEDSLKQKTVEETDVKENTAENATVKKKLKEKTTSEPKRVEETTAKVLPGTGLTDSTDTTPLPKAGRKRKTVDTNGCADIPVKNKKKANAKSRVGVAGASLGQNVQELVGEYYIETSVSVESVICRLQQLGRLSDCWVPLVLTLVMLLKSEDKNLQTEVVKVCGSANMTVANKKQLSQRVFMDHVEIRFMHLLLRCMEVDTGCERVGLMQMLWSAIFSSSGMEKTSMTQRSSLCRLFVGLCGATGRVEEVRLLAYHILQAGYDNFVSIILSIAAAWPRALTRHSPTESTGVVAVMEHLVMSSIAKNPALAKLGLCFQRLCHWECTTLDSVTLMAQQMKALQSAVENGHPSTSPRVYELCCCVELLCATNDTMWTVKNFLERSVRSALLKWSSKGESGISPHFVVSICRLIGRVVKSDMQTKPKVLAQLLNKQARSLLTTPHRHPDVEAACVDMLLSLAPLKPEMVFSILRDCYSNKSTSGTPQPSPLPPHLKDRIMAVRNLVQSRFKFNKGLAKLD